MFFVALDVFVVKSIGLPVPCAGGGANKIHRETKLKLGTVNILYRMRLFSIQMCMSSCGCFWVTLTVAVALTVDVFCLL